MWVSKQPPRSHKRREALASHGIAETPSQAACLMAFGA